jgi:hypothetical protein
MLGAIPPLPQYAFTAWCSVEVQGQLYLYRWNGVFCDFEDVILADLVTDLLDDTFSTVQVI